LHAPACQLLLLEDNDDDAQLVLLALQDHAVGEFAITWVERLEDALTQIQTGRIDAMLSDLDLPDSIGLATVQAIPAEAPALPLVVLTGQPDDDLRRDAIRCGAYDYLLKGKSGAGRIARALRCAMESKRSLSGLHAASEALERRVAERTAELEIANKSLRQSEARFRSLTEMSSDFYWESDAEHRLTHGGTDAGMKLASAWCTPCGSRPWEMPYILPDRAGWQAQRALLDAHLPFRDFQLSRLGPDDRERYFSISGDPLFDATGAFTGYRGVGTGITERKHVEAALARQKDLYAVLSETNHMIVRCRSREELFPAVCRLAVEHGHFLFAWIGLIDKSGQRLVPMAKYGSDAGYTDELSIAANPSGAARRALTGPMRVASEGMIDHDLVTDCARAPRYDLGSRTGARASAKLPIRQGGAVIGAISFYSREAGYFTDDLLSTLEELATDVSFAMDNFEREAERRRAEAEVQRYVEQLKTAFMSTVEVATIISEMRDPYTAGHERRVAEIAVAIGVELGFDAGRVEGLRVAGYLHDIGKITIPSEILAKPGKLTPIEYQFIQGHARASYDVLKAVAFPWPIAQVALQHHERMDGSGYPQGLKGEAIRLESRIIAVADVIEAMASHRPYRPALGIDQALAEIERGRESAYDPIVAGACLKLFREKGYALPE